MNKDIYTSCARLMYQLRKSKGLSQADLAASLGVHMQFVSNIERAKCKIPAKYINPLSGYFGVPANKIIDTILEDDRRAYELASFKPLERFTEPKHIPNRVARYKYTGSDYKGNPEQAKTPPIAVTRPSDFISAVPHD